MIRAPRSPRPESPAPRASTLLESRLRTGSFGVLARPGERGSTPTSSPETATIASEAAYSLKHQPSFSPSRPVQRSPSFEFERRRLTPREGVHSHDQAYNCYKPGHG